MKVVTAGILGKICRQYSEGGSASVRHQVAPRSLSDERKSTKARNDIIKKEITDLLLERAVASFDASALPERPKSACENFNLQERGDFTENEGRHRKMNSRGHPTADHTYRPPSRPSSRPHSGERETSKPCLHPSRVIAQPNKVTSINQKTTIINDNVYAIATVSRRPPAKRENIYENVSSLGRTKNNIMSNMSSMGWTMPRKTGFRKQNSLSVLPVMFPEDQKVHPCDPIGERREGVRKADSFEGHEEAVRTLVAQVHKNRTNRQKDVKY